MEVRWIEDVASVNEAERVARRLEQRRNEDDCSSREIGGNAEDLIVKIVIT
jgi:hypothetical protein